mgnify:CR=1 FL=1
MHDMIRYLISALVVLPLTLLAEERPNFVFIISDDQSWPHMSAYGDEVIETPAFDRIADEGVLFTHSYTCLLYTSDAADD